jgi:hypothetical protein
MGQAVLLRSFAAGELDPGLSVRGDLDAYQQGLRACRNFLVKRSGGVVSRPGLEFIAEVKDSALQIFLYSFVFAAADENYLVEAGEFYFRFHHHVRGMVLELEHPYIEDALRPSNPLYWHQAGFVVSLTHLNYPPMELRYGGPDTFVLAPFVAAPGIEPPEAMTLIAGPAGTRTLRWVATAVKGTTYEESIASTIVGLDSLDAGAPDDPHTISWDAVPNAVEYRVYRDDAANGVFGYIGTTTDLSYRDIGVTAEYAFQPPVDPGLFASEHNYPGVSAVHQQRRFYASTNNARDLVYASRVGVPTNFTARRPMQEDDAISWRTVSKYLQVIRHLVSLGPLVMLTDSGEWVVRGDETGVITPSAINPEQLGYVGAGWTVPVVYGERLLFVQARQTILRELLFNREVEGLSGRDLTVRSAHLFRKHSITSMAFQLIPDAILWCVREDGELLGCTYVPDEEVLAWHRHDTDNGQFEQVCVIPEKTEDALYCLVHRDGVRSIERLSLREDTETVATLDHAHRHRGAATRTLTALPPALAGKFVRVTVNGVPLREVLHVSPARELELPVTADVVDVGLPIACEVETLELDVPGSTVRDQRKKVTTLAVLVEDSLHNFWAGPDRDHLLPVKAPQWLDPAARFTGRIELTATSYFNDEGRVVIQHVEPTTLTVLGIVPNVDVGG